MNRRDPSNRKYSKVENRKDYIKPKDIENRLDHLEKTGELIGILSPGLISDRLEANYDDFLFLETLTGVSIKSDCALVIKKEILERSCNLSQPILNQVVAKFKKIPDVYPLIREDIRTDCIVTVLDVFRRHRFDYERKTRLSSFLFELFWYAILGVTTRHFKDKKKFVPIDPMALAEKMESAETDSIHFDGEKWYED